jgi:hypothetical protein
MQFSNKETLMILELKQTSLSTQQKFANFGPSIKKGSKAGSARNVWSLPDLYKAALYNQIFNNGHKRELAAVYTKSIGIDELKFFIGVVMFLKQTYLRLEVLANSTSAKNTNELIQIMKGHDNLTDKMRESLIDRALKSVGPRVNFYIFFWRLRKDGADIIESMPVIEDDPRLADDSAKLFNLPKLSDVLPEIRSAEDVYILNFTHLMDRIDRQILTFFPGKALKVYKDFKVKIDTAFEKSDGKIKLQDLFERLID